MTTLDDELDVAPSEQQYGEYPEAWLEDYFDEHNFEYIADDDA